jgi:hypothetical protein
MGRVWRGQQHTRARVGVWHVWWCAGSSTCTQGGCVPGRAHVLHTPRHATPRHDTAHAHTTCLCPPHVPHAPRHRCGVYRVLSQQGDVRLPAYHFFPRQVTLVRYVIRQALHRELAGGGCCTPCGMGCGGASV